MKHIHLVWAGALGGATLGRSGTASPLGSPFVFSATPGSLAALTGLSGPRITSHMRQSWTFRLLGLLLMPLFATGSWVAPALRVCQMHGTPASAHSSASDAVEQANPHAAHAGHSAASADNTSNGAPGHGCDCVGCCSGANGPALPSVRLAVAPTTVRDRAPVASGDAGVVPVRFAHQWPFATAPPVVSA